MKTLIGFIVVLAVAAGLYSLRGEAANYDYHVTCTAPTQRTDNTPLTNLAGYRVEHRLCPSGVIVSDIFPPEACDFTLWLPTGNYCWSVFAFDANGLESVASNVEIFHTLADSDYDGVPDYADNCTMLYNPRQVDSDADGYGNRCDGDLNGDRIVNAQDYTLFRSQLGQPSPAPVYNPADLNCNGFVNAQDNVMFRRLRGKAPGPSAQP